MLTQAALAGAVALAFSPLRDPVRKLTFSDSSSPTRRWARRFRSCSMVRTDPFWSARPGRRSMKRTGSTLFVQLDQPDSEISRVNALAAQTPVRVSAELFDLIAGSVEYRPQERRRVRCDGRAVDEDVGLLQRRRSARAWDDVARVLPRVGYRHVRLNAESRTVQFDRPGVEIDFGGIGKGYAVDRLRDLIVKTGVESAFISAGGSSLYGYGAPPDEPRGWPVENRSPRNPH